MSVLSATHGNSQRAQLGREAWGFLHKTADTLTDVKLIPEFVVLIKEVIQLYPCPLCREHVLNSCDTVLKQLDVLHDAAERTSPRIAARAFVARLHACVTKHLLQEQQKGDTSVFISNKSKQFANLIEGILNDEAVVNIIERGSHS